MTENQDGRNQPTAAVEIRSAGLSSDAKVAFDKIARRAYELFESNGRAMGRDLDNWIRAETELFRPTAFKVTESKEGVKVEVDVHGFLPSELEVDLEPRRVTVIGKHHAQESQKIAGRNVSTESESRLIRCLRLPVLIDTAYASASVNRGVLEVDLRKSAPGQIKQ